MSEGQLEVNRQGQAVFHAARVDSTLAARCEKPERAGRCEVRPGPIEVAVTSTGDDGGIALVEPALLRALPRIRAHHLEDLAETAGGRRGGLRNADAIALSAVMQGVLRHIEQASTNPVAVRRAVDALERPFIKVFFDAVEQPDGVALGYRCRVFEPDLPYGEPERDLGAMLHALSPGEHLLLRGSQRRGDDVHVLPISLTRLDEDRVYVNLLNSNGWGAIAHRGDFFRRPGIGKVLTIDQASAALMSLSGQVIEPPALGQSAPASWHQSANGAPLAAWLRAVGPESVLQPTGQRMTPQKGPDCLIEANFAWLGSVLPEADYKLAKAHVLNILAEAAEANELDEGVLERLWQRATSSLSAHAMATGD
jgi:hypothetical protein